MLPPERKKLLVEALRSKKYNQIQGALETSEGNCCLGVACRVHQEQVGGLKIIESPSYVLFNEESSFLPQDVMQWFGFSSSDGDLIKPPF